MDTTTLIAKLQNCITQIETLRTERQAIGSSKVKVWKTEIEELLRLGGKNTGKLLQNFQALKFGAGAAGTEGIGDSGIKFQAYLAELDASERILKNAIQTLQIFGVSEEAKLPDWFKQELKATGNIQLGGKQVDIKTITVHEFLSAIITLSENDKSLDETLKKEMTERLEALKQHPLLSPFLNQTIDKVFSKL